MLSIWLTSLNAMGIKISFAVAYDFNQLIYAVCSPPHRFRPLPFPAPPPRFLALPLLAESQPVKKKASPSIPASKFNCCHLDVHHILDQWSHDCEEDIMTSLFLVVTAAAAKAAWGIFPGDMVCRTLALPVPVIDGYDASLDHKNIFLRMVFT